MDPLLVTVDLISIIVPCFNHGASVGQAVRSALASDWSAVEVIVADDGSAEDIAAALGDFKDEPRLRLIRQEHKGVIAARKAAIEASAGRWIAFLDADDEMTPTRLSRQMEAAEAAGAEAIVFCGSEIFRGGRLVTRKGLRRDGPPYADYTGPICRLEMSVNTATMLLSRALYDRLGGFDTAFVTVEGHLIVRAVAAGNRLWIANTPGYRVHRQDASLRTREPVADIERLFALIAEESAKAPADRRALLEDYRASQMVRKLFQSLYRSDEERGRLLDFLRKERNLRKRDRILIEILRRMPFRLDAADVTRLFLLLSRLRDYLRRLR